MVALLYPAIIWRGCWCQQGGFAIKRSILPPYRPLIGLLANNAIPSLSGEFQVIDRALFGPVDMWI
ncbi:hypothetical protein CSC3H3_17255 [Thalassospira marina]|uniref:Uncharacterized protein n=1 Tax=Thalassospira marina TaxID=2048283 RepID=A0ABM6QCG7_9PROT|nr:hypothetical protein CSC3H3_17255 [Thalassospira marina]